MRDSWFLGACGARGIVFRYPEEDDLRDPASRARRRWLLDGSQPWCCARSPSTIDHRSESRGSPADVVGIGADNSDRGDPQLKALRQLRKRLGVKRSDKAFVVDIYVSSDDRTKSVRIADAIAQAYLDSRPGVDPSRAPASSSLS